MRGQAQHWSPSGIRRQYEAVYTTNLDFDETLANLKGIMTVIDKGPVGIRYLRWKNTTCNFGRLRSRRALAVRRGSRSIRIFTTIQRGMARRRRSYMGTPAVYLWETVLQAKVYMQNSNCTGKSMKNTRKSTRN